MTRRRGAAATPRPEASEVISVPIVTAAPLLMAFLSISEIDGMVAPV